MSLRNQSELQISAKIIYKDRDGREISYRITKQVTTIGKQAGRDIQISDPYVSRHHADLVVEGKRLWIDDKGSTNGVFLIPAGTQSIEEPDETPKLLRWNNSFLVNGKEQLHDGCTILVGNTELRVRIAHGF